jgi:hypothetical protein
VQEELSKLESIADYDFRVKAYKTEQWSFRWSLPAIRVFQSAAWPRLVFYDTRMADFFCSVPSEWLCARQMQIDYLKRFAPDLAHIIWQPYRANLYAYRYYNSWLLPRRALEKLWRSLTRQQVTERNWEVQFLCPQGRAGLNAWLLRPGLRLHEYFSPASLSQLLADFQVRSLDKEIGYTLSMLVTFSAWLETYG